MKFPEVEYVSEERRSIPGIWFAVIGVIVMLMLVYWGYSKATAGDDDVEKGELNAPTRSYCDFTIQLGDETRTITLELFEDKAPITCSNFRKYVEEGFYDETIFHRVIEGFVVQGGGKDLDGNDKQTHDPIKLERNGVPNTVGTVAMARQSEPNTATSQFFFNVQDNDQLNPGGVSEDGYCVFGQVTDPDDFTFIYRISKVEVNADGAQGTADDEMPRENVVLEKARMK